MKRRCGFRKPDGGVCQANATATSGLCFFHDPDRTADRRAAQRAGGLRSKAVSLSADTPDLFAADWRETGARRGGSCCQFRD